MVEQTSTVSLVSTTDVVESTDQSFNFSHPVAYRYISQCVADVTQLHLDVIFVAQQVIDFNTCQSHIEGEDCQLGLVKIINGVSIDKFCSIGIIISYLVDFGTCIFCHLYHFGKGILASESKVTTRDIKRCQQEIGCA